MVVPGGNNPTIVSQVSLVHASDSIRAIGGHRPPSTNMTSSIAATTPSTSTGSILFSTTSNHQRMSKPPGRVVAQPGMQHNLISHHQHQQQYQLQHHNGYGSMKSHNIPTMSVQPMAGRSTSEFVCSYVKRPTAMLASSAVQRSAVGVKQNAEEILHRVRAVRRQVADEETELRRLRELETETSILREKNSGREQELANDTVRLNEQQTILRNATLRVQSLTKQLEEMYKRRQTAAAAALVEHRKLQQQQQVLQQQQQQQQQQNRVNSTQISEVVRPRASVEPFQVVSTAASLTKVEDDVTKGQDQVDGATKIPPEPTYLAPSPVKNNTNLVEPHVNGTCLDKLARETSNNSIEKPCEKVTTFAEKSIPTGETLESKLRSGKTDLVSLRSDSLKATKRRSWAASEGTSMSEAEVIHRLLDEQRRGRTHFIPQLPTSEEEQPQSVVNIESNETSLIELQDLQEKQQQQQQPIVEDELKTEERGVVNNVEQDDTTTEDETSSCSVKSDDEPTEIEITTEKKTVKGILRKPNEKMNKGRIEFDPLALLLDAALEGELDLVKSSASKLDDVSQANDEGITALHNAICAGHYEIVRFLIEHDADVNAQDSDGWTPLHCAASCNNLPMVRQLVEGGGCVLASTLSDMETPVEKCEEEEDGYDGCLKYLVAAHNATGSINGGKVYAAYSYESEHDDELSFEWGEEFVVLSKDDVDKHWWTCRKTNDGKTGLVPRTYLALYPALKFRKNLNFVMFDLPLENNNNAE